MPLRAKIDETKLPNMSDLGPNGNGIHANGTRPKTGIKVIIIGAGTLLPKHTFGLTSNRPPCSGFGGLTAAIECIRHGHTPVIYESFPELKILGDIITFGPNAGRIFARWSDGRVARDMRTISIDLTDYGFNIHKWDTGEIVLNQKTPPRDDKAPMFNGHRGELHEIVFNYAKEIGVEINLGHRVNEYWENADEAGIVLEDGTRVSGDVVVASDGVRSKARTLVLGYEDKPKSSGYAVWRAWFSNKDMLADPETKHFCDNGDTFNGWIGTSSLFPCLFTHNTN